MLCLSSQHLVFDSRMYFHQGVLRGRLCVLKCKINTFSVLEVSSSFNVNLSTLIRLFLPTVNVFFSSTGCYYEE
jgi:hypothetical protein